jgi:lantibiotic modifying enzyme
MEGVGHKASRSKREVEAFFYRGGALLYLAHIFRAVDLHAGNLVARGEHPILVDCETFLHPATPIPALARWSMSSLVRTGLLPAPVKPMDEREEITAFGRAEPGPHRQEWRGRAQFAGQFIEDFLRGFTEMHSIVTKKDLVTKAMKLFPRSGRVIYRPTQYYQAVYDNSLAPGTLMNGFDRSMFLHAACRPGPIPQQFLQSEVTALADGDVPLFSGRRTSPRPPPSPAALRILTKRIQTLLRR